MPEFISAHPETADPGASGTPPTPRPPATPGQIATGLAALPPRLAMLVVAASAPSHPPKVGPSGSTCPPTRLAPPTNGNSRVTNMHTVSFTKNHRRRLPTHGAAPRVASAVCRVLLADAGSNGGHAGRGAGDPEQRSPTVTGLSSSSVRDLLTLDDSWRRADRQHALLHVCRVALIQLPRHRWRSDGGFGDTAPMSPDDSVAEFYDDLAGGLSPDLRRLGPCNRSAG